MPVISDLSAATAALGRYTAVLGQDRLNLAGGSFTLTHRCFSTSVCRTEPVGALPGPVVVAA
jgi:hypothetical protein